VGKITCPLVAGKGSGVEGRYRRKTALEERREMATVSYHIRDRDGRSGPVAPLGLSLGLDWLPINRRRDAVRKLRRLS
jgi:hypothetical protein